MSIAMTRTDSAPRLCLPVVGAGLDEESNIFRTLPALGRRSWHGVNEGNR